MNRDQVEAMISEYKANVGRCAHLDIQIKEQEQALRRALSTMIENEIMPGTGLDRMPHGNNVNRQVEEIACRYADGYLPQEIIDMQSRLTALQTDRESYGNQVSYVDAWLSALNDKQCWIIRHQMIEQDSWRETVIGYRTQFGEDISKNTIKRMKDRAIDVIMGMIESVE